MIAGKKRGMLGSVEVDVENYWTAGKDSQELRCNETVLYAEIDDCQSDAKIAKTRDDVQAAYNRMDMFWLCLQAISRYALNSDLLRKAGVVVGNLVQEGRLSLSYTSVAQENANVVAMAEEMYRRTENFREEAENSNFMVWYVENVLDLNYYQNTDGTRTVDKPRLDGLGATSTSDQWSAKMKDAGAYLLYHVSDAKKQKGMDQKAVARKMAEQEKMLTWLHNSSNNMTRNSILANARSGIKEQTGMTPQDALLTMGRQSQSGTKGLGEPITIIAIVVAAIYLILKVVSAVMAAKYQNEVNKAYADALNNDAPDEGSLNAAAPANSDFTKDIADIIAAFSDEAEEVSTEESIWSNPLLWIGGVSAIGLLGIFAVKASKKSKKNDK